MKKKFALGFIAITLALIAVFVVSQKLKETSSLKEDNLSTTATNKSYIQLDARFQKCTPQEFQLSGVDTTQQMAPLFEHLGNHHFAITTSKDKAQTFFDQGLRLTYGFNHAEAHRSFMEAARLDPSAAMAYWGQAYALGPNINDPFPDDERKKQAFQAIQKAKKLSDNATAKESELIHALSFRYSDDLKKDISELNQAYMSAMQKVAEKYPDDAEVLTLYADAIMNTMPWNYWDNEGGHRPHTMEGKQALEKAMKIDPKHPGANHFYIHLVELPQPDLAIRSAETLGALMPAAGHMVHMPAHIFIRVGRYKDAVQSNIDAIAADEDYISQCYSQGMYPLTYYPHNIHFLWSAATLLGDSKTAIEAAKKTAEKVPAGELANLHFLQDFASTPILAYTRFGKWNEILTIPYPGNQIKHLALIWHYGRGIAFVRKNNLKEAEEELAAISSLKKDPELEKTIANFTNPSSKIAKVAYEVLAGEIAAAKGNFEEAIANLEKGVAYEDELAYSEPTAWHIPVRQTLGAILLKANQPEEAARMYKEDLAKIPKNGWSLMGLSQSLKAQGKTKEAKEIRKEFNKAWVEADVEITASVL